jgi:ABC-2 type transport system permease protein
VARGMPQWLVIARREFLERVRTMWFVIVTLLGPIGMVGILVIPAYLGVKSAEKGVHIEIVDHTDRGLGEVIAAVGDNPVARDYNFRIDEVPAQTTEAELLERIRREQIDGFLILPADVMTGGQVVYKGDNATNFGVMGGLHELVNYVVRAARARDLGIEPATAAVLMESVRFDSVHTTGEADATSGAASFIVGYTVMFILYMAILLYAVNVLRSVVQEKTSRVVEIMVSAVKPRSMMFGKILGVGGVGLFQLCIWAIMALLIIRHREAVLGLFGVEGAGAFSLPSIDVVAIVLVLAYFLLGYFFYASLYAAIGAMVNSDQEAQQMQTPVVILLIIPVLCVQIVANDPRGAIAEALTLIPFSSPVLMPMRYLLGGASGLDVLLSLAVLVASIAGAVFVAARVYRVGILMYGKRPSLRELWRWIRY